MQDFFEPKAGDSASDFSLESTDGEMVSLRSFKGNDVILYFYPKDDTPGCTAEACSFRDNWDQIQKEGAVVLGVSTDTIESHRKFREKHNLNFPLLSDPTADVAKMFGMWKEKNLYGRRSWGVARGTYWIGANGRVRKVWKKVDTATHGADVLAALREGRKSQTGK